jgi:hypothetical protein
MAEDREALRARILAGIPRHYSPWVHLACPSVLGLGTIVFACVWIRDLRAWELLTIPIVFILGTITEWHAHRDLLHRRTWPLQVLYDRHTPEHHRIFVTEDMAMRSSREFRLVLIPAYGLLAILVGVLPIAVVLAYVFHQRNVAALYLATAMGFAVSYEWLHLAYHLPASHPIARLGWVARLARHHATHHDPTLMQKWNFNVTFPVWDWIRGTIHR